MQERSQQQLEVCHGQVVVRILAAGLSTLAQQHTSKFHGAQQVGAAAELLDLL
jgi:hypothetical protein